jgi:Holliday junction DNA helicase RuvA
MFYSLKGNLSHIDAGFIVIECCGVGYYLSVTRATMAALPKLGEETLLYTYMHIRENSLELFGFKTLAERACFKLLTSVSGVGPKLAVGILSELGAKQVAVAAAMNNSVSLTKATGVGAKLAERIILELKDKLEILDTSEFEKAQLSNSDTSSQAVNALTALGFSPAEAAAAVIKLDSSLSAEELIQLALRSIKR